MLPRCFQSGVKSFGLYNFSYSVKSAIKFCHIPRAKSKQRTIAITIKEEVQIVSDSEKENKIMLANHGRNRKNHSK
jgi:hypothetical protein